MKLMTPKKIRKVAELLSVLDKRIFDCSQKQNPEDWYVMCADIFYQVLEIIGGHKAVQAFIHAEEERKARENH